MAAGMVMPSPKFVGLDNNGDPINGGKLHTFLAGTTTPAATYSDQALTTPNANPVILDSAGRATVYLDNLSYKFEMRLADDTLLWTVDNVVSPGLFIGKLATLVPFGHAIGDVAPSNIVQLMMGGTLPIDPADIASYGLWHQPVFDSSLNTAVVSIIAHLLTMAVTLPAAGTPAVYSMFVSAPSITSGGAVPSVSAAVVATGVNNTATRRYALWASGGPSRLDASVELGGTLDVTEAIGADVNNWAPTNIQLATLIRVSVSGANRNVSGIASGGTNASQAANASGRFLVLHHGGSANNFVLLHESGLSSAENRFSLPGAANFNLTPGSTVILYYDGTASRWIKIG